MTARDYVPKDAFDPATPPNVVSAGHPADVADASREWTRALDEASRCQRKQIAARDARRAAQQAVRDFGRVWPWQRKRRAEREEMADQVGRLLTLELEAWDRFHEAQSAAETARRRYARVLAASRIQVW